MSEQALMVRDGIVDEDRNAEMIYQLQGEVTRLRRELAIANGEIARAKTDAAKAVAGLRKQLTPLYRALQSVFGEIEAIGGDDATAGAAPDARTAAIWQSWKGRLGPQCGKVIDALLLQSEMNTTQLAIAIGTNRRNIPNLIFKLNQAGLINKNGGRFSLKPL